jgi:hypothetical protein
MSSSFISFAYFINSPEHRLLLSSVKIMPLVIHLTYDDAMQFESNYIFAKLVELAQFWI